MGSLSLADVVPLTLTTVTFPSFHPLAGQTGIVNAIAIRHTEGVVLVDTGIGEGNAFVDHSYRPERHAIDDELRAVDLDIGDVVAVINGHLHFDNIGGNALFPGVPIFVHQDEWDAAHAGGATYRNERLNFDVLDWIDFPGATYRSIDGEYEVVPSIRLIPTPGQHPWSPGRAHRDRRRKGHSRRPGALRPCGVGVDPRRTLNARSRWPERGGR